MTMRYAHMVTDHLHRAMEALGTKPGTIGTVSGKDVVKTSSDSLKMSIISICSGGEGGIRTHGTGEGTTVFETAPIDHSGTSPQATGYKGRPSALQPEPAGIGRRGRRFV